MSHVDTKARAVLAKTRTLRGAAPPRDSATDQTSPTETVTTRPKKTDTAEPQPHPRRWQALALLGFVQFMVVVDATIVNVALPSIQRDLGFSPSTLTWVVNGYILAACGMLMVAGRVGDVFGRRRMFLAGTAIFAIASLAAGLAQAGAVLVVSRFIQGAGEALAGPAAMAIVVLLFTDPKERARAFGVWGGLAGVGAVAGVLLSGVLTDLVSWRLIFLINVPLAVVPLLFVPRIVEESRTPGRQKIDVFGAVLITAGVTTVVAGVLAAARNPWTDVSVLVPLMAGGALFVGLAATQSRSAERIIPPGLFANRVRLSGYATIVFLASTSAVVFFLVVLYMQDVLGYSPLQAGLGWLPFCAAFLPGLMLSGRLSNAYSARAALVVGLATSAAGLAIFGMVPAAGGFLTTLGPAMLVTALGFGITNPALQATALHGLSEKDAGIGSGVASTIMQLGSALGLAVFVTVALRLQGSNLAAGLPAAEATTASFRAVFWLCAGLLAIGAITAVMLVDRGDATEESAAAPVERDG